MRRDVFKMLAAISIVVAAGVSGFAADDDEKLTSDQVEFFESKIRPVLINHCYSCHSESGDDIAAGLSLDTRNGLRLGGDSGPAIEPGKSTDSLLLTAIEYNDRDLMMPPKKAGGKLPDSVIADFRKWIEMGAPDPRESEYVADSGAGDAARQWWAFQPRVTPTVPTPANAQWARSDIDRFVLAKLEECNLTPVGDADPLVLLRRVYFDLIGLPPDEEAARTFQNKWESAASEAERDRIYAQVVDSLLASPQFGERWGRHWLDVARYSESSGKDVNILYPLAWRYRDYVIDSLNADLPFDQFIREQIAGDLLPAKSEAEKNRQIIATGYLAIGPKSLNDMNPRQFAVDVADEQIDAFGQSFVGLTIACARCHDHKFDPISQEQYTELAGIFLSTDTRYGTSGGVGGRNAGEVLELTEGETYLRSMSAVDYAAKQQRLEELRQEQRAAVLERRRNRDSGNVNDINLARLANQVSQLEAELKNYNDDGSVRVLAMGAVDKPATRLQAVRERTGRRRTSGFETVSDSPLFMRGEIDRPGERIDRGVPDLIAGVDTPEIGSRESGRLQLADWLTDPDNPLTARVAVNRIWHWLFGAGIVTSVDNFGNSGTLPSHPELLDYLANRFIDSGWSMKSMIREIVLSRSYRLSSEYHEANFNADPANALIWRHNSKRLEAEAIRDSMLHVAGRLDLERPEASIIGRSADGPLGAPRARGLSENAIVKASNTHRSVYMSVARNAEPEVLALFDFPDAAGVQGARQSTNVPSQSLFLLNSTFVSSNAEALAKKVVGKNETRDTSRVRFDREEMEQQLDQLYWIVFCRPPTAEEVSAARELLGRYRDDGLAGWTSVARALMASAEFRSID